jgi:hypothetical protein
MSGRLNNPRKATFSGGLDVDPYIVSVYVWAPE